MSQIYLFTGDNVYAMQEERKRWTDEFRRRHGPENLVTLDGAVVVLRTLLDEVSTAPFLAERRLVFVDGGIRLLREHADLLAKTIHPSTVLVFLERPGMGRRTPVKSLQNLGEVKEFPLLKGKAIEQWVRTSARARGVMFLPEAEKLLIELGNADQGMIAGELEKLALMYGDRQITAGDVEQSAVPSGEGVVWRLTDLLCAGRTAEAVAFVRCFLERGGDPFGIWGMLLKMVGNVVLVRAAIESGKRSFREVSDDAGIHPFAARSLLPLAKRLDQRAFRRFLGDVVDAEIALKTGAWRTTNESNEELLALIDRFIVTCP